MERDKEQSLMEKISEMLAEVDMSDAPADIQLHHELLRLKIRERKVLKVMDNADENSCKVLVQYIKGLNNEMDKFLELYGGEK